MGKYKISFMRFGHAVISADSEKEAADKAKELSDKDICWHGQDNGSGQKRFITLIEKCD